METSTPQPIEETSSDILYQPAPAVPVRSSFPIIIAVIVTLLALSAAAYFFIQNRNLNSQLTSSASPVPVSLPVASPDPTAAGWQTFTHPTQNYQFNIPAEWNVFVRKNVAAESLFGPTADSERGEGGVEVREINIDPKNYHDIAVVEIIEQEQFTTKLGLKGYITTYKSARAGIDFVFKHTDGLIYNIYVNSDSVENIDKEMFNQILSTFKFTELKEGIPAEISQIYDSVNKDFAANFVPTKENEFYSLQGFVEKESWKLNLENILSDKSQNTKLSAALDKHLTQDDTQSADGVGQSVRGYQNDQVYCYLLTGFNASDYLSCIKK